MEAPQWWPSSLSAAARLLLLVGCALLAGYQCCQLLKLFRSEPVALTLTFTPRSDVGMPSISVCTAGYSVYGDTFRLPDNESLGKLMWERAGSLSTQLQSCRPSCNVTEDIPYPGGSVAVPTGTWSSWIWDDQVCHSFTPNITWGELPTGLESEFSIVLVANPTNKTSVRYVHVLPRRQPLLSSYGVKDADPDNAIRVRPSGRPSFVFLSASSHVHERPSLRRAPCNDSARYDYGTCVQNCYTARWAAVYNCSRPQMLADFPALEECSFSQLDQELNITEHVSACRCLPTCRLERLSVTESTVTTDNSDMDGNLIVLSVTMSQIPQEVATEQLSYHAVSLFSEMGGYISLLLGVSAVSAAELAVQGVAWCRRALRGGQQPRKRSPGIIISAIYP